MLLEHATCVDLGGSGVLLRGPSGSGKSDLALRLIDGGAQLVADDYVELRDMDGRLVATAPAEIAGVMEVRGIGLIEAAHTTSCPVDLVVDLVDSGDVPRLPEPGKVELCGQAIECCALAPFETSACAKVRLALRCVHKAIRRNL